MNTMMTQLPIMLRREMWEHKNHVVWLPVGLTSAALIALLVGLIFVADDIKEHISTVVDWGSEQRQLPIDERARTINFDTTTIEMDDKKLEFVLWGSDVSNVMRSLSHGSVLWLQVVAFFAAVFYLLASLHSDRVNKSILFWKSLPVSETKNVFVKLLFALFAFPFVALSVSIVVQCVLAVVVAYFYSQSHVYSFFDAMQHVHLFDVISTHSVLILMFAIKTIPLYAWLLLCSAMAKTTPFAMAMIPPLIVLFFEKLIFGTSYTIEFLTYLFYPGNYEFSEFLKSEFSFSNLSDVSFSFKQLCASLSVSAVFLAGAVWLRNNRYEI